MYPVKMMIACDGQALEQMMDGKCTSDVPVEGEEEDDGGKMNPQKHFCQHWRGTDTEGMPHQILCQ
jgi:hypothetical protein